MVGWVVDFVTVASAGNYSREFGIYYCSYLPIYTH